ncbi:MAG: leucine-rich repeat domain-containing protein [Bacteroidota bacterium]
MRRLKISDNILLKLDHPAKIIDLALDWELISSHLNKKWEEIPDLSEFTQLKKLSLAGHEIKEILDLQPSLTHLDLSYNLLRQSKGLAAQASLKELDLSFNEVEEVEELADCTKLRQLNLAHNFLKDLSPLHSLKNLQILAISGNRRIKDLSFVEGMKNLTLFYAKQLNLMEWGPVNKLSSLEALYISLFSFESLASFDMLPKLETLHLSVNKVGEEGSMPYFPHLKELSIVKGKHLRRLRGIEQLKGLMQLNLAQNQLEAVPDLNGLYQLESVDLRQNPLTSADSLFELPKLKKLDIRDTALEGSVIQSLIKHFEGAEVLY